MMKIDYKKTYKTLYAPSAKSPSIVEVPEFGFIMIDGAIEKGKTPDTSTGFSLALETLYGLAYTIKFMSKQSETNPVDYTVLPLEGIWWVEDGNFDINKKDNWHWRLMIMQPEHITKSMFDDATEKLKQKKDYLPLEKARFEYFMEGKCVQIMHIGPYSEEPATVERLHAYAHDNGFELRNDHHEIYIGDPRKSKPDKLKTILRHAVK